MGNFWHGKYVAKHRLDKTLFAPKKNILIRKHFQQENYTNLNIRK